MTENEKLDLILVKLDKLDKLESAFVELSESLGRLESEFKEKQDKLECDVTAVKLTLENEIRPNIMRVAEGHQDLYRKLREATKADDEKEMIAIRVSILETELWAIKEQLGQIA